MKSMRFLGAFALLMFTSSLSSAELIEVPTESRHVLDLDQVDALVIPEGARSRLFVRGAEAREAPVSDQGVLTEAELLEHLNEAGIEAESRSSRNWGRPWVEVVVGVGVPNLFNGHVEVRVSDQWTVGAGGGVGLLPSAGELLARYTPGWSCWGCTRRIQATLSFGPDVVVMPDGGRVGVILAGAVEAEVVAWLTHGFGLTFGTRWGLGVTRDFGPEHYSSRIEPALSVVLLQVGGVFGERR